jgi:hypothetical protein
MPYVSGLNPVLRFALCLIFMQPLLGLLDLAALVPQELLASAYIDLTNVFYSE